MITLLAAAALLAQPELGPKDLGRAAFYAGMCSGLGYSTSAERAVEGGLAFESTHPEGGTPAFEQQVRTGIEGARADAQVLIDALRASADFQAFGDAIMTRCDSVVRDFPTMLERTAATEADFEAAMTDLAAKMTANSQP